MLASTTLDRCEIDLAPWRLSSRHRYSLNEPEPAIQALRAISRETGLPLFCVDVHSGTVLARSHESFVELLPIGVRSQLLSLNGPRVFEYESGLAFYAVPLPEIDELPTAGVGYVRSHFRRFPKEAADVAASLEWDEAECDEWLNSLPHCRADLLERLLESVITGLHRNSDNQQKIQTLERQVNKTCEEIGIVHNLTSQLLVSREPVELGRLCLRHIHSLIDLEGSLILLDESAEQPAVITEGTMPLDQSFLQRLVDGFCDHDWSRPLLRNDLSGTMIGADLHHLRNFMLFPVTDGTRRDGWILLCNIADDREIGVVESSLLSSIATILATQYRNRLLFNELEELILQFISSLVSTLDAKDPYTRGHSERVARIGRRLGQELQLPESDLELIYQSGLLHDIGKIGINDAILQKKGALTDEEFEHIKLHPMIGYRILSGLKNLRKVLPGVRNHHENFDGTGYPDGLAGESIPLMARILAVADGYDAMHSDRSYRQGLSVERIEDIFRDGAGSQWDPRIVDAYFRARDDIRRIGDEGISELSECEEDRPATIT